MAKAKKAAKAVVKTKIKKAAKKMKSCEGKGCGGAKKSKC